MKKLLQFAKDESGAVFIIIGLCFLSMVGVTAAAVDFSRGNLLKSELVSAVDTAGLAGGTVANSENMTGMANKYFDVNLPANYMGSTIDEINPVLAADKATLTISGAAHLKNSMMQIVGWDMTNVVANTEITIERKGLEVVLVMDNTGSMGTTNMTAMKNAATNLINILYGNKETIDNLYVGLVPYASMVNIGTSHTDWLTSLNQSLYSPTTWKGCVKARGANETNDDTPAVGGKWTPFFWESGHDNRWWCAYNDNNCKTNSSSGGLDTSLDVASNHSDCGSTSLRWKKLSSCTQAAGCYWINENQCAGNDGSGPNLGCPPAITPLVKEKTTVLNAISAMNSWSRGGTMSDLGMAWGWRVISPKWRGLWGSPSLNTLPLDYHTPLMEKVVILLTDGDNLFYDNYGQIPDTDRTGNGRLSEGLVGTTNSGQATTAINARLTNLCTAMKQEGVIIYTITFSNSPTQAIRDVYKGCASQEEYYFNAPSTEELEDVFNSIGDSLSNLRISK